VIALLQRVTSASVVVEAKTIAEINQGLLVFLGIEKKDDQQQVKRLLERVLNYRLFSDSEDKMNLSLKDIRGELLLVPQFTLAADTKKGLRPGFSVAASPEDGERLYGHFVEQAMINYDKVSTGRFGADMKITLLNDGPVTFILSQD